MGNCLPCLPLSLQKLAASPQLDASRASMLGGREPSLTSSVLQCRTQDFNELFQLANKLGHGQFGITYLCIEKATGARFACKTISKCKLLTQEDVADVRREIRIMHHLSGSPDIVSIKGAYEDVSSVYLVMELCAGGELFDRIIDRGHYSERQAAELMRTIVSVVETCHSLGVMHRDLKPENFLFSTDQEESPLRAIDFGLSVFFKPGEVFHDVVGSAYYVAPEVLQKSYGPASDVWSAGVILYILLSGVPPFWAETDEGIFEQILKGVLDLDSDPWPHISESVKDLLRNMLNLNSTRRFTAQQVLCHPWIQKDGVAPDRPLDPAILVRMKQFSAMNKMKKIALRVIAERLSNEEIAGLKKTFKMIDTDCSGTITFDELKAGFSRLGSRVTQVMDNEIRTVMEAADVDKNGSLDYEEFITATLNLSRIHREEDLAAAFSYFDRDGNGYITVDELQHACVEHKMGDGEILDIIKEIDQDNDGCIDYNEFVAMMRKSSGAISRRTPRNSLDLSLQDIIMLKSSA